MESLCTTAAGDGNGDGITGTELRALIIKSWYKFSIRASKHALRVSSCHPFDFLISHSQNVIIIIIIIL
jgi:hypothetical protein